MSTTTKSFAGGLRSLLAARPDSHICGEATDGQQGVETAKALRPALILMDISTPRMNGLEAARIIRRDLPETTVVIISQYEPAIARLQAHEVSASGYISKSDLSRELLPSIARFLGPPTSETQKRPKLPRPPHRSHQIGWRAAAP